MHCAVETLCQTLSKRRTDGQIVRSFVALSVVSVTGVHPMGKYINRCASIYTNKFKKFKGREIKSGTRSLVNYQEIH